MVGLWGESDIPTLIWNTVCCWSSSQMGTMDYVWGAMWSSIPEKLWSPELIEILSSSQREYNIKNKQTKDRRETTTTIQPPHCSLQKYPLKSENFFYFDSSERTFPTPFVLASRSYVLDFACGYPWGNLHTGTQNFDKSLSGVCFHLCKFILLTQLCGWKD